MKLAGRAKTKQRLLLFLKTGMTPERMALCIALGATLGTLPVIGTTTLLCTLAAVIFRLNLAAIQVANYLVYPLQLALLVPFMRIGEWFFGIKPVRLSFEQIRRMAEMDHWGMLSDLLASTLAAVAVWMIIAPLGLAILYLFFLPLLRKIMQKQGAIDTAARA